ncbi:unnamed protein product [Adineta steineri]|uniref:Uncharacterized protein n=1 Tax=Adineta steineri TaxID=433720 RepID=A0A818FPK3_9BILA|nr:unnamed protein product [Adineta steineri]CAF3478248.1 unnamed protein product [Adineta steineri]
MVDNDTQIVESNSSLSIGKLSSIIFNDYTLYKCEINNNLINNYLQDKLLPFENVSWKNSIKNNVFHSKPIKYHCDSRLNNNNLKELSNSITFEELLLNLLKNENKKNLRYNFVITGNYLSFMEIPHRHEISYYLLSKHISLSDRSNDVRFAGEFWCDEKNLFKLNNNSGTYTPSNDLIQQTIQLFNQLTPQLHFQGLPYQISLRPSIKSRFITKTKAKLPFTSNS